MRPNYFDFDRYRWRGTYRPTAEYSACRAAADLLRAAMALFRVWAKRTRERRELATLDHLMRRDIGVTPCEIDRECAKPFWRA
jgi:uncharacterized protein YjiS (DUF1127 family)